MTDEEKYNAKRELEAGWAKVVCEAVPDLRGHYLDVYVDHGRDGLPHRLTVGGPFVKTYRCDGKDVEEKPEFTFFDDRDLKRIALALARTRQAELDRLIAGARERLDALVAKSQTQAKASAEVERALGR